jgi:hypothetical protein
MKKILGVLLGLAAVSAFADDNNLYVGVGAGAGWNDVASPAAAFRVDAGYKVAPGFAVEVGTTGVTQSGGAYNASQQMYDLTVKGILPLGDTFDLFAQVGGAYQTTGMPAVNSSDVNMANSASMAGWQFVSGGGFDINLTKSVSFNITDLYYYGSNNALGNSNVVLGGMKFSF